MSLIKASFIKAKVFYKILNIDMVHYGFKYKVGENIDILAFNPKGYCSQGGLYFIEFRYIPYWWFYGSYIATINIDENEDVWNEINKFKAHKINILKIQTMIDFLKDLTKEELNELLDLNDVELSYNFIHNPTEENCIKVLELNGNYIKFIENQTEKICLEAIKQNPYTIRFVKNQTDNICFEAIKYNPYVIKFITEQKDSYCYMALKENYIVIKYIKNLTFEILQYATTINKNALYFVKNLDFDLAIRVIKSNKELLKLLPFNMQYKIKCLLDEELKIQIKKFVIELVKNAIKNVKINNNDN